MGTAKMPFAPASFLSKNIADKIGYFDERLIAYGEEDGDFKNRYFKIYNKEVESVFINGIDNRIQNNREDSYDINIQCFKDMWGGNKPLINRTILNKKSAENWSNEKQYPYEKFLNDNYHNIGKVEEIKY